VFDSFPPLILIISPSAPSHTRARKNKNKNRGFDKVSEGSRGLSKIGVEEEKAVKYENER